MFTGTTMNAYFYLSRKRLNSRGVAPIYCRVASPHDRADFATGLFIPPKEWSESWSRIAYLKTGQRLSALLDRIYTAIALCEREGLHIASEAVKLFKKEKNRLVLIEDIVAEFIQLQKPSNLVCGRLNILVQQLRETISATLAIKISPEDLRAFERALFAEGYSAQTVFKKLQLLKRVMKYAAAKGYIGSSPFTDYKLPTVPRVNLVHLTSAELAAIERHTFASARLNQVKDLFLFQCYTGLSYADLNRFTGANVLHCGHLRYLKGERAKTAQEFTAPWFPEAACIADKYNYTLPVISNQRYNAYLKEVMEVVGIDKNITTHIGRKTFAQMMLDRGFTAEAVTRMMGHSSFTMTQKHYARIGDTRVINEIMKMTG